MKMLHILATSALMKVINVLGDHSQSRHMLGKLSDSEMSTVWLRLNDLITTPVIPTPAQ